MSAKQSNSSLANDTEDCIAPKDVYFKHELPQRYSSISMFCNAHGIPIPRKGDWRLTDRVRGNISGVPNSDGILTATDGILCFIEQEYRVFCGHVEHFIEDKEQSNDFGSIAKGTKGATSRKVRVLAEFQA